MKGSVCFFLEIILLSIACIINGYLGSEFLENNQLNWFVILLISTWILLVLFLINSHKYKNF